VSAGWEDIAFWAAAGIRHGMSFAQPPDDAVPPKPQPNGVRIVHQSPAEWYRGRRWEPIHREPIRVRTCRGGEAMIRKLDRPFRLAALPRETRRAFVNLKRALAVGRCGERVLTSGKHLRDPFAAALARLELARREALER